MIAVECLLHQLEDQKNGLSTETDKLPEELVEQIVELLESITGDMEEFTWTLYRNSECLKATQQFSEIAGACDELLAANLSIVETAHAVATKHGHATQITRALNNISARTRMIHAQLCEYADYFASSTRLRPNNLPNVSSKEREQ